MFFGASIQTLFIYKNYSKCFFFKNFVESVNGDIFKIFFFFGIPSVNFIIFECKYIKKKQRKPLLLLEISFVSF